MIIKLPHVEPLDTLKLPEDFEARVKESFAKYTEGTREEYTFEDKLQYIDNLRGKFLHPGDAYEHVKEMITDRVEYELDDQGDYPEKEEFWSFEFMCECFEKGNFQFRDTYEKYSSSRNEETLKIIFRIVQIVINWEEERET